MSMTFLCLWLNNCISKMKLDFHPLLNFLPTRTFDEQCWKNSMYQTLHNIEYSFWSQNNLWYIFSLIIIIFIFILHKCFRQLQNLPPPTLFQCQNWRTATSNIFLTFWNRQASVHTRSSSRSGSLLIFTQLLVIFLLCPNEYLQGWTVCVCGYPGQFFHLAFKCGHSEQFKHFYF